MTSANVKKAVGITPDRFEEKSIASVINLEEIIKH